MAPLLGDRYLDRPPRPLRELAVSAALRAAGAPTPRVVAAVVAWDRPGYRGDLAIEWLEPGHDLEPLLRPGAYPAEARAAALRAAGRAAGAAHRAGLHHPDLQLRNLFVRPLANGEWEGFLLDLDRARIVPGGADARVASSLARLERSLRKARARGRIAWQETDRAALLAGHAEGLRGLGAAGAARGEALR
jgi:3-deoxy-D-manno-octulosonic acid kinase